MEERWSADRLYEDCILYALDFLETVEEYKVFTTDTFLKGIFLATYASQEIPLPKIREGFQRARSLKEFCTLVYGPEGLRVRREIDAVYKKTVGRLEQKGYINITLRKLKRKEHLSNPSIPWWVIVIILLSAFKFRYKRRRAITEEGKKHITSEMELGFDGKRIYKGLRSIIEWIEERIAKVMEKS